MTEESFSSASSAARGLHLLARFAAAMTFILIFVGGLVTSTGSGLAVPDWPLAFGRLIPPHWIGGIRFEYSHRVMAGTVAILTLALAGWAWFAERRRWVRGLALAAFGLVIAQALLGALNVLFMLPLPVTVAHAATAQLFFCLMVGLAMFTNPGWDALGGEAVIDSGRPPLRTLAAATTGVIYLQILIGALMRNLGAGLAIPDFPLSYGRLIPPGWTPGIAVNFAHRSGAIAVAIMVTWTVVRVARNHRGQPLLMHPALGLLALLALQIALGALTIWSGRAVLPTTAHVAIGAAVLATAFALTIRAFRLTRVGNVSEPIPAREPYRPARAMAGSRVAS